jgi:tRNA (adenine57-N1/adenine58-N1)-methyltransferase catalytic subunit
MAYPQTANYGDVALFISTDRKNYVRTLTRGDKLATHLGNIPYDDLIGLDYGTQVKTHLGNEFYMLQPAFEDLLAHARHDTTIIQPKDLGFIALKLNIRAGSRVIEAGTGSGGLTTWLASLVGDSGRIYSYDRRAGNIETAKRNLTRSGVLSRVTFDERDIGEGFDQTGVDVTNPYDYLEQARAALVGGGHFGALVPTMNQAIDLTGALFKGAWFRVEVEEIWQRSYKVVPARLRPEDRMIAHTGYLVFARAVHRAAADEKVAPEEQE